MDLFAHLLEVLPSDLLIDLEDRLSAEAQKAADMIKQHSGLNGRRMRGLTGQARFRMAEQGFEEVTLMHGGLALPDNLIPGTKARSYQPFSRFSKENKGVVLGFSSMPEIGVAPSVNKSRLAGSVLNQKLQPSLFEDARDIQPDDVFVLILFLKDHSDLGKISEFAVGVLSGDATHFLFYRSFSDFMAAAIQSDASPSHSGIPTEIKDTKPKLRDNVNRYVPPEESSNEGGSKAI